MVRMASRCAAWEDEARGALLDALGVGGDRGRFASWLFLCLALRRELQRV